MAERELDNLHGDETDYYAIPEQSPSDRHEGVASIRRYEVMRPSYTDML